MSSPDVAVLGAVSGPVPAAPSRPWADIPLSNGELRREVANARPTGALAPDAGAPPSLTRVEVIHALPANEMKDAIVALGGVIEGEAEALVQASVPTQQLVALEHYAGVEYIRPPVRIDAPAEAQQAPGGSPSAIPVVGEEVAKTNAAAWLAAGWTGAGVKVGIVDTFGETSWTAAIAAGEVPAPAGTFCQANGADCGTYTCGGSPCTIYTLSSDAQHGTAVAEVIHEMAPDAQIYLASVETTTDLQAAVNYFAAQGVKIISRSLTAAYDGPGDGTGPISGVVNSAVSQGVAFINSAGNSASDGSSYGGYWRGGWSDPDANGYLNWTSGDELLGFACTYQNGLRWSDWGTNRTDYDLFIYDGSLNLVYSSTNDQVAGDPPIERSQPACDGNVYHAAVRLSAAGGGTAGDVLEFGVNGCCIEHSQNPYSASGPVADSANTGEMTVGAIDPPLGTTIAPYSSQGPTNDDRIKPDLSAAACVASFTYSPDCFPGTSASTPATAGAAALVLGAGLASTPAQLKTYLMNNATVDRGDAGIDNIYGKGELILPAPPAVPDTDGDGCNDPKELLLVPPTDPNNPWDFYSVPVPALFAASNPLTDFKDSMVRAADAQAIFAYYKAGAQAGTPVYDQDLNGNGIQDGIEYDRSFVGPGQTGAPDGVVRAQDAQLAFAQYKFSYKC